MIAFENEYVKDFVDAIGEKFKASDKEEKTNLMSSFMSTKGDNVGRVRDFILRKHLLGLKNSRYL